MNLSQLIFSLTYKIICRAGFGAIGQQYEENFESLMHEMAVLGSSFDLGTLFPSWKLLHTFTGKKQKLQTLHRKLNQILDDIIDQHKKKLEMKRTRTGQPQCGVAGDDYDGVQTGDADVFDVLLKAAESEGLGIPIPSDNIKAVILVSKNSFTKILTNLVYLKLVIKETMRVHPPVVKRCQINGYNIPVKTQVIVNTWAIGIDPQYWDDGESFIPERFENSLISNTGKDLEQEKECVLE